MKEYSQERIVMNLRRVAVAMAGSSGAGGGEGAALKLGAKGACAPFEIDKSLEPASRPFSSPNCSILTNINSTYTCDF